MPDQPGNPENPVPMPGELIRQRREREQEIQRLHEHLREQQRRHHRMLQDAMLYGYGEYRLPPDAPVRPLAPGEMTPVPEVPVNPWHQARGYPYRLHPEQERLLNQVAGGPRVEFVYGPEEYEPVVPEEDREVRVVNEFLVGCDPEFVVLDDTGGLIQVQQAVPQHGPIGWDHGGKVLELRPKPAKSSFTLTKHLWEILKANKYYTDRKFRAGAYINEMSLGGHVHLDVPFAEKDFTCRYRVLALDELTTNLEGLDILPQKESEKRRNRIPVFGERYGQLGDVRVADRANRMEYRTMASWLFSPITSFLCLTAAKIACAHPKETIQLLGLGEPSKTKLQKFFETFQLSDIDAKRVIEKIFDKDLKLQRDPSVHVMDAWKVELPQLA